MSKLKRAWLCVPIGFRHTERNPVFAARHLLESIDSHTEMRTKNDDIEAALLDSKPVEVVSSQRYLRLITSQADLRIMAGPADSELFEQFGVHFTDQCFLPIRAFSSKAAGPIANVRITGRELDQMLSEANYFIIDPHFWQPEPNEPTRVAILQLPKPPSHISIRESTRGRTR